MSSVTAARRLLALGLLLFVGCGGEDIPRSSPTTTAEGSYTWSHDESLEWGDCVASRLRSHRTEDQVRAAGEECIRLMRPDLTWDADYYGESAVVTHGWNDAADGLTFGTGLEERIGR